eukprot:511213-Pelagomonas_calceolata.AAC.6
MVPPTRVHVTDALDDPQDRYKLVPRTTQHFQSHGKHTHTEHLCNPLHTGHTRCSTIIAYGSKTWCCTGPRNGCSCPGKQHLTLRTHARARTHAHAHTHTRTEHKSPVHRGSPATAPSLPKAAEVGAAQDPAMGAAALASGT